MTLLPRIDEMACCAHGDCAAIAPGVFAVEEIAVVTGTGPDDLLLEAARACPAAAIELIDADTGEPVDV
jgi:ferredoxin